MTISCIQIKPVLTTNGIPHFSTTTNNIEIEIAILIGIEKSRIGVFLLFVRFKYIINILFEERTITLPLIIQFSCLSSSAANIEILKSIVVDIGNSNRRAFGRQLTGNQSLGVEITISVFLVRERNTR